MTSETFFENFGHLADAPNGVEKLRELILQMAVRGQLTHRNEGDLSAKSLLSHIRAEQKQLYKEGIIRKPKKSPEIKEEEVPFNLPDEWVWVRLADVGHDWGQKKPDSDFHYIDVSSIDNARGKVSNEVGILSAKEAPSRARKIVKPGTLIYSTVRPYLLNIAIIDKTYTPKPIASTAFAIIHPFKGMNARYLFYFLRSKPFIEFVEEQMSGMAYPAVSDGKLFKGLVPLTPLRCFSL